MYLKTTIVAVVCTINGALATFGGAYVRDNITPYLDDYMWDGNIQDECHRLYPLTRTLSSESSSGPSADHDRSLKARYNPTSRQQLHTWGCTPVSSAGVTIQCI